MRILFCVPCLLFAVAAQGQASDNSAPTASIRPRHIQSASHSKHAKSASTTAHGEKLHGEAMPMKAEVPLGDTARALRKKHSTAKKARTVFEN